MRLRQFLVHIKVALYVYCAAAAGVSVCYHYCAGVRLIISPAVYATLCLYQRYVCLCAEGEARRVRRYAN